MGVQYIHTGHLCGSGHIKFWKCLVFPEIELRRQYKMLSKTMGDLLLLISQLGNLVIFWHRWCIRRETKPRTSWLHVVPPENSTPWNSLFKSSANNDSGVVFVGSSSVRALCTRASFLLHGYHFSFFLCMTNLGQSKTSSNVQSIMYIISTLWWGLNAQQFPSGLKLLHWLDNNSCWVTDRLIWCK